MKTNSPNEKSRAILSALFAALILVSAVSCAEEGTQDTPAPTGTETVPATETTEPPLSPDHVEELDFGGAIFRTIQQHNDKYGFYHAEENGDVIVDELYRRNRYTEERLNVTFAETVDVSHEEVLNNITNLVTSGDDAYDLVIEQMFDTGTLSTRGMLYDWNEIPYVDFNNPWYVNAIRDTAIGDHLYIMDSDICFGYITSTWMIVYDRTKAAALDMDDLYSVVDKGEWTIDKLLELSADTYQDINADGKRDAGDFYGLVFGKASLTSWTAFYYGGGARMVTFRDDGTFNHNVMEEHAVDVMNKLYELFVNNPGSYLAGDFLSASRKTLFPKGASLFSPLQVGDLLSGEMREFENNFGVLPIPKYDTAQKDYYTVLDGGADVLSIPLTIPDPKLVGAVTEIMSAYSYAHVTPAIMDVGLEQKGTRDEESVRMLRIILDSRVLDLGYLYDGTTGWANKIGDIVQKGGNAMSYMEGQESKMTAYYLSVIGALTK